MPRQDIAKVEDFKGPPFDLRPAYVEAITDRHYLMAERDALVEALRGLRLRPEAGVYVLTPGQVEAALSALAAAEGKTEAVESAEEGTRG